MMRADQQLKPGFVSPRPARQPSVAGLLAAVLWWAVEKLAAGKLANAAALHKTTSVKRCSHRQCSEACLGIFKFELELTSAYPVSKGA